MFQNKVVKCIDKCYWTLVDWCDPTLSPGIMQIKVFLGLEKVTFITTFRAVKNNAPCETVHKYTTPGIIALRSVMPP